MSFLSARDALIAIRELFDNVVEDGAAKRRSAPKQMAQAVARLRLDMPEKSIKIRELEQHIDTYFQWRSRMRKCGEDRELANWALVICSQLEATLAQQPEGKTKR